MKEEEEVKRKRTLDVKKKPLQLGNMERRRSILSGTVSFKIFFFKPSFKTTSFWSWVLKKNSESESELLRAPTPTPTPNNYSE